MESIAVLIGYITKHYMQFELKERQNGNDNTDIGSKANRFREQLFEEKNIITDLFQAAWDEYKMNKKIVIEKEFKKTIKWVFDIT